MATMSLPATATLSHLRDDPLYQTEVPYEIWTERVPDDIVRTNVNLDVASDCHLTDIRTLGSGTPRLQTHSFEWFRQKFPFSTGISSADDVEYETAEQREKLAKYLDSMTNMLRQDLGCEKAICYDWRVRRSKRSNLQPTSPNIYSLKDRTGENARAVKINASHIIHADGSPQTMQNVVASVTSEEEKEWTRAGNYRVRVLTVWRPLVPVVETDPLVLCDARTVAESDWDIIQKVMDEGVEESMYLKRREKHMWYWMSGQTWDDVIVLTDWDSHRPFARNAAVPHCAMILPDHPPNAKPRESIELRCIVWNRAEDIQS